MSNYTALSCHVVNKPETFPPKQFLLTDDQRLGLDFIIKDLPSEFNLIIDDHIVNDSLCCSYKYN